MMAARHIARLAGEALLAAAFVSTLSGCEASEPAAKPAGEKASAALEAKFGAKFIAISEADPNSKPREVSAKDLPPVSLTEKPIDF